MSCLVLGLAVTVGVTMYVLSISELSEVQMVGSAAKMRSQPMDVHVSSNKKSLISFISNQVFDEWIFIYFNSSVDPLCKILNFYLLLTRS